MGGRVSTFLMFGGNAGPALRLYARLFDDFALVAREDYGEGDGDKAGLVKQAEWTLAGQRFMVIDSPVDHGFTFTPSISIFVECADDAEIERLFAGLSEGGQVLMALDKYPFSTRFGWVNDPFGVSWQLNLP